MKSLVATLLLAVTAWRAPAQDAPKHYVVPWIQAGLGAGGAMVHSCDPDSCSPVLMGTFGAGLDIGRDLSVAFEASNYSGAFLIFATHLHAHMQMFAVRYQPSIAPYRLKAGVGRGTYDALGLPRSRARLVGEIGVERPIERRDVFGFVKVFMGSPATVEVAPGVEKKSQLVGVELGFVLRLHIG